MRGQPVITEELRQELLERFSNLIAMGEKVVQTRTKSGMFNRNAPFRPQVSQDPLAHWSTSSRILIQRVFGSGSLHFQAFSAIGIHAYDADSVERALGALRAAKDDFDQGFAFNLRSLVEADLFSDILDQAEHLLEKGYHPAAAVLGGVVLEDAIRSIHSSRIGVPKKRASLEALNEALGSAGVYSKLKQKQISHLAAVRNAAAHGEWSSIVRGDVVAMLRDVRRFVADWMS